MDDVIITENGGKVVAAHRASATPADLVRYALDSGADLDRLEKLMALQTLWEEREAKKAFVADMAEFKRNPPEIHKDKHVDYELKTGGRTQYDHATIGNVVEQIVHGLASHGFSHRWVPARLQNGNMQVTCVVTHKLGHSEETTLDAPPDTSAGKAPIQAMASTITYLERYSILAAVGLATKDMIDDENFSRDHGEEGINLGETWVQRANKALTIEVLESTWALGVVEINAAKDRNAYNSFKAAVVAKKTDLEKPVREPGMDDEV